MDSIESRYDKLCFDHRRGLIGKRCGDKVVLVAKMTKTSVIEVRGFTIEESISMDQQGTQYELISERYLIQLQILVNRRLRDKENTT